MLLVLLLVAVYGGGLKDIDNNGTYRIGIVADSNTAILNTRTSWVTLIQDQNLLPQVHALRDGAQELEDVVWANSAVVGFACVGSAYGIAGTGVLFTKTEVENGADAILAALGTNDLETHHATPEEVVRCYLDMQAAAALHNVPLFIATTPPVYPPFPDVDYWNAQTGKLNALVRSTFNSKYVIDFDTGFTHDMYLASGQGRHLNDAGEILRAQRAVATLIAAQR